MDRFCCFCMFFPLYFSVCEYMVKLEKTDGIAVFQNVVFFMSCVVRWKEIVKTKEGID